MNPASISPSRTDKSAAASHSAAMSPLRRAIINNYNNPSHEIFHKFTPVGGIVPTGFRANFLGVKTNTSFFCNDRPYVPDEYPRIDDGYFEWIDLLESVTSAKSSFTMIELGAGYGHWLANAAAALKQYSALPYHLIGVEAEPTHFRWMKEHLQYNQVDIEKCRLIEAAVHAEDGTVGFHTGDTAFGGPGEWYGQAIGGPSRVQAVSLNTVMRDLDTVDFLDLDIQGAELEVLQPATKSLAKVKRVHVATHSRAVEAGLRNLFNGLGWRNINDYEGGTEQETEWGRISFQDGVQTWINPNFFSAQELDHFLAKTVRTRLGIALRVGGEDFIAKRLFEDGIFEPIETDLVLRLLRPGDICLDGGCHVGYYTTLMASLVAPRGQVYAFDANPRSCRLTERSLILNNLQAEVIHAAIGDCDGTTAFHISSDDQTGLSSLGRIDSVKQTIFVPWLRLEDFIRERTLRSIRLLKLDVEGAEELVLRGLGGVLDQHLIDFILLECYDERLELLGTSAKRLANLLWDAGYTAWEFGTKAASGWSETSSVPSRGDCNYLFSSPRVQEGMPKFSLGGTLAALLPVLQQKVKSAQELVKDSDALRGELRGVRGELAENKNHIEHLEKDLDFAVDQLRVKDDEVWQVQSVLRAVQHSVAWRLLSPWRRLRDKLMPTGSRLRELYERVLQPLRR